MESPAERALFRLYNFSERQVTNPHGKILRLGIFGDMHLGGQSSRPVDGFNHLTSDYATANQWFNDGAKFESLWNNELPNLESWIANQPTDRTDPEIAVLVDEVREIADKYQNSRAILVAEELRLERSAWEEFSLLIAPYLISVAIGLSVFKAVYAGAETPALNLTSEAQQERVDVGQP